MTAAPSAGPRYAPEDPTLPKPWKGLIDGSTGYHYFWNPETNVTQYERPVAKQPPGPPSGHSSKSASMSVSSLVHAHQSSGGSGHLRDSRDSKEDDGRYGGSRSNHHQGQRGTGYYSQSQPNGSANVGHGLQSSRLSAKQGSSDFGGGMSAESYTRQHEITVMGDNVPAPFTTFESTGFPSEILKEVHLAGFPSPTPIQAQAWPIAMQGRDVVAVAKTGSGKTLGYLLPGFLHLSRARNNSKMGPTVLVLAPTRELATQILQEANKFGRSSRISSTCLYGGAPKGPQLRDIDRGMDIVVATPGRLNDILEMRRISLRQVSYLVLDEADRMLDMGFEPQIRKIVKEIPSRRQTLMFTATWPKEVRKIAADLLVNPVQVNIGSIELVANKAITQYVEVLTSMEKQRRLEQILRSQEPGSKILIFCSTKRMCDQLARNLTRQFGAAAIHGDKSQGERDHVLGQFRTGRSPILVATDVAARGLDIKDIRVVVNYDFPTGIEDYVHRIGRTGRAGATGVAYTFFSAQDSKHALDLVKVLEGTGQKVPVEIRGMATSRGGSYGKFRRWGAPSGNRDAGRSYGGRNDFGYGGRGGGGSEPSFGRSGSGRGGRGQSDHDRHGKSYHDSYVEDSRARPDTKSVWGSSDRGGERDAVRSRSRSYSPKRGYGVSGSSSRSRSRNPGRSPLRRSHSRSRSRSPNRGLRNGDAALARGRSPPAKRESSPKDARALSPPLQYEKRHSPTGVSEKHHSTVAMYDDQDRDHNSSPRGMPEYDDKQQCPANGYSPRGISGYDRSLSPRVDGSPRLVVNGWGEPVGPTKERSRSPVSAGNMSDDPRNGNGATISGSLLPNSVEEEEGMIPVEDDGFVRPLDGWEHHE